MISVTHEIIPGSLEVKLIVAPIFVVVGILRKCQAKAVVNPSKRPYEIPCKTNCHDIGIALEVPCEVPCEVHSGNTFPCHTAILWELCLRLVLGGDYCTSFLYIEKCSNVSCEPSFSSWTRLPLIWSLLDKQ
jgi:hypothetical protein